MLTANNPRHEEIPMLTKRELLHSVTPAAITLAAAKSTPVLAQAKTETPGFFKAKDVAEAGFIYGLPIVMNYGVMYDFAIDQSTTKDHSPTNPGKRQGTSVVLPAG